MNKLSCLKAMLSFELDEGKTLNCDGIFQALLVTFVLHNSIKDDIYEFFEENEHELDKGIETSKPVINR